MPDHDTQLEAALNVPFVVTPKQIHKFVGCTAVGLPAVLMVLPLFVPICFMTSISHFYYSPIGGDVLVGSLSVIGAIMLYFYAYKGDDDPDNSAYNLRNARLAKLAGLAALGVAFFPTSGLGCAYNGEAARFLVSDTLLDGKGQATGALTNDITSLLGISGLPGAVLGAIHYLSAAAMFGILGYFSFFVFTAVQSADALENGELTEVKKMRNRIYRVAGGLIFFAIAALAVKFGLERILDETRAIAFSAWWNDLYLTFIFEALGLIAFGVSWLVKARIFGWLEDKDQDASANLAT